MSTVNPYEMSEDDRRREVDHLEWSSIIGVTMSIRRVNKRRSERQAYLNELTTVRGAKETAILQARIALGSRLIALAENDNFTWSKMQVSASAGSFGAFEFWRMCLTKEEQRAYSGYRDRLADDFEGTTQQTVALIKEVREMQSREADH